MNVTYRLNADTLFIAIEGRVDASNAAAAEEKIFEAKNASPDKRPVIDAEHLEYISSAGLRIILKLRKDAPELSIINVSPEVYDILEMTGFTDMVTVERAYRTMSIEGCEFIAKGANGAVYRYDDETIVKTYFAADCLDEIKQERENARKAFVLGVNTAIPYDIVRVGDGYGSVTELLRATSVSKLVRANPENLELPIKYFIDMLKSIHAIDVKDGEVPNMKDTAIAWASFVAPHLPAEQAEKLCALVEAVPHRNTLLHGDYHTNNVMVQGDEPLLIDMDTLCMGHPVFELGSMFNAFIGYAEVDHETSMSFFGYDFETSSRLWDMSLRAYLGTEDKALCDSVAQKAMVIGYTRMLRRAIRRPNEKDCDKKIARCKEMLAVLLEQVDTLDF